MVSIYERVKQLNLLPDSEDISEPPRHIEGLLLSSMKCYELAIELSRDKTKVELLGRLGNVQNELGVKYMYHAQGEFLILRLPRGYLII